MFVVSKAAHPSLPGPPARPHATVPPPPASAARRETVRGRGAAFQPANRFRARPVAEGGTGERAIDFRYEPLEVEEWGDDWGPGCAFGSGAGDGAAPRVRTTYLRDASRSILARNDSPDIPFDASINPYRGCEHGCAYCYARPTHEFAGMSAGLDFESRILVKTDAPKLLRAALARPGWSPQVIAMSGVTDPYQPIEKRLELTRGCLQVLAACRNPVGIVTKSHLVARDLDVLAELNAHRAASVALSITTLDAHLARTLEPRAPGPSQRLHAIHQLAAAGIPVGVMVAPVIPGLTDDETPAILRAAAEAGATFASYVVLRLPYAVRELFVDWLDRHVPDRKGKVLERLRSLRTVAGEGDRLNDPTFGSRMRGHGPYAQQLHDLFHLARRKAGLQRRGPWLATNAFRRPRKDTAQLQLFEA